uniref:Cyclin-dependent kinase inhibitor domain-containing protein n=1 Tax=Kalanchoe fedtschenkoi TaxID=63787 RepID=A0A7N0UN36_KALFE
MGKYMKKFTAKSDVAAMETPLCTTGVRTRAKTLALQKLQQHKPPLPVPADPVPDESSYLQLRSRRLLKLKPLRQSGNPEFDSCPNFTSRRAGSSPGPKKGNEGSGSVIEELEIGDPDASFAENDLDFEAGQIRASRESTPCNSVRGSDSFGTPGSTTRSPHLSLPRARVQNAAQRVMPTASEIEEFFALAEQHQQRIFLEKYNFDVVSGRPMPGRYEWVPVNP